MAMPKDKDDKYKEALSTIGQRIATLRAAGLEREAADLEAWLENYLYGIAREALDSLVADGTFEIEGFDESGEAVYVAKGVAASG